MGRHNEEDAMTINDIYNALDSITIGMTKIVNGHVITRWTADLYEIDTFGKTPVSIHQAADIVR